MFTGIVEEVGRVRAVGNGQVEIAAAKVTEGTAIGDSIAVNGVCLTVTTFTRGGFTADVMPVTLARTALGSLRTGDGVNLERALTLSARLGGHIVSGHIDGVGSVQRVEAKESARIVRITAVPKILRYVVPRGSVALDGVSLTVAEVDDTGFIVSLIPHTRQATTLDEKKAGAPVNIENDIVGKYVDKLLRVPAPTEETPSAGLTAELLQKCGFSY
ncbi:MAG: riboflavin synthase [Schwartzia sp.]|nr:riboflavin synthase [Schwartzia sp. (in: firmicutes)]